MTYLAISTNTADPRPLLEAESARMAELIGSGAVQHFWLKPDWSGAVMILSADSEHEAQAVVDSLPVAAAGLTTVALTRLSDPPPGPPAG